MFMVARDLKGLCWYAFSPEHGSGSGICHACRIVACTRESNKAWMGVMGDSSMPSMPQSSALAD